MSALQRMWTLIMPNLNAFIGRAEDPKKMIEQALLEMSTQLARTKQRVASAVADEKKLKAELDRERQLSEEWESRAMLALKRA